MEAPFRGCCGYGIKHDNLRTVNKVFADGTVADPGAHKANPDLYIDVSKTVWDDDDLEVDVNKGSKFAAPAQVKQ